MKKIFTWLVGIIAVIIIILIFQNNTTNQSEIKVGVIGHFSGNYADYGVPMKNSIELAADAINKSGGINNRKVQLYIEDDASSASTAATAMNKLISVDKVNYILSAQASAITAAITPIAQSNKRILMITLGSAPDLTKVGNYIFRSVPSDSYQGIKMVDLINNDLKSKKVAGLYINDTYGAGIRDIINENQKVANADTEMFESQATDVRTQLLKIKQSGADTLVIVAHTEYPAIFKQIKELSLNVKIIASETFKDKNILKQCGSNTEGAMVTFMADQKDYVDFNDNYQKMFNTAPSAYSMYGYDGFIALAKAIENSGDNVEKVKNNLSKVQFNGASGNVGFDENRNRTGITYSVFKVVNGEFVRL